MEGVSLSPAIGEAIREGRRPVAIVLRVRSSGEGIRVLRVPVDVYSLQGQRVGRVEAFGLSSGEVSYAHGVAWLPPGDYKIRSQDGLGWLFRVSAQELGQRTYCVHSKRTPTVIDTRLWFDDRGCLGFGSQQVSLRPCCEQERKAWRSAQEYSLTMFVPLRKPFRLQGQGATRVIAPGSYAVANPQATAGPADRQAWPAEYVKAIILQPTLKAWREEAGLPKELGALDFDPAPRPLKGAVGAAWAWWEAARRLEGRSGEQGWKAACQALLTALLHEHPNGLWGRRRQPREPHDDRLRHAMHMLEERYAQPLDMADVAREVGVTLRWLQRSFRRAQGCHPTWYLQQVRMRHAKALLADARLSVEEVAARVGYRNPRAFYRMFKRWLGTNPRSAV